MRKKGMGEKKRRLKVSDSGDVGGPIDLGCGDRPMGREI